MPADHHDDAFQAALSDLANALQTAAPIASQHRQDAATLDDAITRAVRAVRQLQPTPDEPGGAQ